MDNKYKNNSFIKFFCNYGEFHDNLVNKIIHVVCIPTIAFTLIFLLRKFTIY